MLNNYILFLLVSLFPLWYKYSFWLYAIQLKEYRWDRFKEYLITPQGKQAIFNFWFFIELPLFLLSFSIFYKTSFEYIIFPTLFYFFLIQNIFVIGKILRKRILKPKLTGRLLLTTMIILIGILTSLCFILQENHFIFIYTYITALLLFAPVIIFISVIITLPIVIYLKNKRIKKASLKSKKTTKPIKIGITGSYGKSSVKEFLGSILEQHGDTLKTPENINTEMGVSALILTKLKNKHKYFVAEMGAYKRGEIHTLGNIVNHKYGFLTAVGTQHIGIFGNIENTKLGKAEIAEKVLENKGILYINWENKNIQEISFPKKLNIIKYGNETGSDVKYEIIASDTDHTKFKINYKNKNYTFETNLVGKHNILNISGVIAFCLDIGIEKGNLKKYVKNVIKPKNTLEIIKTPKYTLINDSYNLPENGALAAIDVLSTLKGPKILVIDDIFELGNKAGEIHTNLAKKIAKEQKVDKILFVGKNFKKYFEKGLLEGGFKKSNILTSLDTIKKGDNILFEGRSTKKYFDKVKECS